MLVSMDRVGRIALPKDVRFGRGIEGEAEFELTVEGDEIRETPQRRYRSIVHDVDGLPVIEAGSVVVTDADVQRWRDADQR